jgi:hypothetical protein
MFSPNITLKATLFYFAMLCVSGIGNAQSIPDHSEKKTQVDTSAHAKWSKLTPNFKVRGVACLREYVFAGVNGGSRMKLSSDHGIHWHVNNKGMNAGDISSMAVNGDHVFAGSESKGIFRFDIGDKRWIRVKA